MGKPNFVGSVLLMALSVLNSHAVWAELPATQIDFVESFMKMLTADRPTVAADVMYFYGIHTEFNSGFSWHCQRQPDPSKIEACVRYNNDNDVGPRRENHFFTAIRKTLDLQANWELTHGELVQEKGFMPFYRITVMLGEDELTFSTAYAKNQQELLDHYQEFGRLALYEINNIGLIDIVKSSIK